MVEPSGTDCVNVVEPPIPTCWFVLTLTQFPLSILYLIQKYAVVFAEPELAIVNVEVAEPPEQLPSDCETEGSI